MFNHEEFMFRKLLNIRLSHLYFVLFAIFMYLLVYVEHMDLSAGQLALFSVNSFLFGYYFGPVMLDQKNRVDAMNKTVRDEAMVILDVLTQSHLLANKTRLELKVKLKQYLDSIIDNPNVRADNDYYDDLLHFTTSSEHRDNPVMNIIYKHISKTQQNRDTLNDLYKSPLYSHEWIILLVLFSITLFFVLQIDYGQSLFFQALAAILCTGLTLLIIILAKYSTLTHKEAKQLWVPLRQLRQEHFEDVV